MKQVIITFTRHEITQAQLEAAVIQGAEHKGLEPADLQDVIIVDLTEQAKRNILTDEEADDMSYKLSATILNRSVPNEETVLGVFGVFPAPLLEALQHRMGTEYTNFFSAWNVQRTPEGGKPTFEFKRWCKLPLK